MARTEKPDTTFERLLRSAIDEAERKRRRQERDRRRQYLYAVEKAENLTPAEAAELCELRKIDALVAPAAHAWARLVMARRNGKPTTELVSKTEKPVTKRRGHQARVIDKIVPELYPNGLAPDLTPGELRRDVAELLKRKAHAAKIKPREPPGWDACKAWLAEYRSKPPAR